MNPKVGILLTNIGTPDSTKSSHVRRYLKEFLSDSRVVELPKWIWLPLLYGCILPFRSRKSASLYQKIWTAEGAPLKIHTMRIADQLQQQLNMPVEVGMHYGSPSIEEGLLKLKLNSVDQVVVLPLFPQYSATTSASTFDRTTKFFHRSRIIPAIRFINYYYHHPLYISALTTSLLQARRQHGNPQHVLFSFHGIPKKYHDAGDSYAEQCQQTAKVVAETLALPSWSIAFQSRLGKATWLTPYTESVLTQLPRQGISDIHVICPGFAADCLETLEEIAIRGKEQFFKAGGSSFHYVPALNDSQVHITLLKNLIEKP